MVAFGRWYERPLGPRLVLVKSLIFLVTSAADIGVRVVWIVLGDGKKHTELIWTCEGEWFAAVEDGELLDHGNHDLRSACDFVNEGLEIGVGVFVGEFVKGAEATERASEGPETEGDAHDDED